MTVGAKWVASLACLALFAFLEIALHTRFQHHFFQPYFRTKFARKQPTPDEMLHTALQRAAKDKKVIVLWHSDQSTQRMVDEAAKAADLCPRESCGWCDFTVDKKKIQDQRTAAVVFLYKYVSRGNMWPSTRRLDQLYIWWTGESPSNMMHFRNYDFGYADGLQFNATMTYRRDSDIYKPYGRVVDLLPDLETNMTKILQSKRRVATAVVSNCHTLPGSRRRLDYLKRVLSLGFDIVLQGECFGVKALPKEQLAEFIESLKIYKFYFAFENSYHCRDYVTEKLFRNAFQANSVPVVWGATKEDYEAVLPPNSFIYAEDFSSLSQLTDYLNYLDKNDTAYLQYLRWRTKKLEEFAQYKRKTYFCQLCRILHGVNVDDAYSTTYNPNSPPRPPFSPTISHRRAPPLAGWMYGTDNTECLDGSLSRTLL